MGSFQAPGPCEEDLDDVAQDSARSVPEKISNTAISSGQGLPTSSSAGKTSDSLKRSSQDLLASGSHPSSLEDLERRTEDCYKKTLRNFEIWSSSVSRLNLPDDKEARVKLKMEELEVVTKTCLSDFLNKEDGSQIVSSYPPGGPCHTKDGASFENLGGGFMEKN
ncbi:uncharacterized protein PGTG_05586 [Puccinia graminis f. sp. tritici CRL 75-36-700-3]|uniref:Uncharacterized protein n=1 Tax=Puccinia graminis f. sp. tritici (strain CRL 75-36-700-3 / race SCCL) TaxID=418459 RepID=E3K4V0_PUCGT|nr:uncharacterized protein PGTG_05586 [Puccinia graminis f. sp. tritici CRL 75-36-700-3]EFP79265.1 hypothetical protein PGTG_05586 [Puccinia graminis f. sp. tritici CRL 75-36-700-3]